MIWKLWFCNYMYVSLRLLADNFAHCHLLPICHWWHLQHCSEGKEQCMLILIKSIQLSHRKKWNPRIQFISERYFIEQHYSDFNNNVFLITVLVIKFCSLIIILLFLWYFFSRKSVSSDNDNKTIDWNYVNHFL